MPPVKELIQQQPNWAHSV